MPKYVQCTVVYKFVHLLGRPAWIVLYLHLLQHVVVKCAQCGVSEWRSQVCQMSTAFQVKPINWL